MRILLTAFSILVASCSVMSCSTEQKKNFMIAPAINKVTHIEVQGHRGARGRFPENSLPGFEFALKEGVDVLELDLGVTKDGELVVAHDEYLNKEQCVGSKGQVLKEKVPLSMLTLAELKTYICGKIPHPRFPEQKKIAVAYTTLREVFELVKNSTLPVAKTVGFNIETKITPGLPEITPPPHLFAAKVIALVHEYGFADRTTLQSFDHRTLVASKKIDPNLRISPLIENTLFTNLPSMARDLNAEIISPNLFWITKSDIEALHKIGVKVIPWTANDEKEWAMLIDLNVDGIITDYPDRLITYLKSKGLR